jgi:hypothetical protein
LSPFCRPIAAFLDLVFAICPLAAFRRLQIFAAMIISPHCLHARFRFILSLIFFARR